MDDPLEAGSLFPASRTSPALEVRTAWQEEGEEVGQMHEAAIEVVLNLRWRLGPCRSMHSTSLARRAR